jgi:molybdenum-dependent DNA-binding transcriptional regulator ModE
MLTPEERALVTDIGDRLLELYEERDEARTAADNDRVREAQRQIDRARAEREQIIHDVAAENSRMQGSGREARQ